MEDLVQFIAEQLVEEPEEVSVYSKQTRRTTILKLRTAPDDTGRVIGRNGRVANAMRSLLQVAARNSDHAVILEID
ncbi:MAG: KH domain-containing protein [Caldilineaceae bacterium]|nr:KH domain-containing protein [Caldilineaceae bacterium]MCB9137377.1 KH domain-containing protein [Caldilineaceae bacterium]